MPLLHLSKLGTIFFMIKSKDIEGKIKACATWKLEKKELLRNPKKKKKKGAGRKIGIKLTEYGQTALWLL